MGSANLQVDENVISLGGQLQGTITKWYYAIRNIVLVIMMIILLYIGIRIVISGISSEKAKYKNMLMDWVVAICLVFMMHYIMVFAINLVDGIINIFNTLGGEGEYAYYYELTPEMETNVKNAFEEAGMSIDDYIFKDENGSARKNKDR